MNKSAWLVFALASVASAGAAAQSAQPYFRLDAGYSWGRNAGFADDNHYVPAATQIAGSLNDIGNSAVYGFGAGYQMNKNVRWDVSYARRGGFKLNDTDRTTAATAPNPPGFPNRYQAEITSDAFMLNGAWTFDTGFAAARPFIGGGIGWARNKLDALKYQFDSTTNIPGGFVGTGPGGSKSNVAWQLTAGLDFSINNALNIEVAYRYADMGKMKSDPGSNTILAPGAAPAVFNIDGIRGKLSSNELNAGLRYKF